MPTARGNHNSKILNKSEIKKASAVEYPYFTSIKVKETSIAPNPRKKGEMIKKMAAII